MSTNDDSAAIGSASEPAFELKETSQDLSLVHDGLERWMREALGDPGATISNLRAPNGTGVANETVLFAVEHGSANVAARPAGYVARLASPDPLYLDADLMVHYRMYETMAAFPSVPTPAVVGFEADAGVVGAPFFVMEEVVGQIPTDQPSWASEGFVVDAEPRQRRRLWERTVMAMAAMHELDPEPFEFLRTGATDSGAGDCLDYWIRSMRWATRDEPAPLAAEAEAWLLANVPDCTALSWGDSRFPNVISRDFTPVALLDWDLVSLAGPQTDLAWWMIMSPNEAAALDGIGSHDELVELWEHLTGRQATDLRWYLVLGAYRLAAILTKLFSTMVSKGHLPDAVARAQISGGLHVQLMSGLLELPPPAGVTPLVPSVRLDG
jgi:aminoglycoside phosphotransferase (APT) family kinase protein